MSFMKIWSRQGYGGYSVIQAGQLICWHHATFEDLMTEKSRMIDTSLLTGIESGVVGGLGKEAGTRWLLAAAVKQSCYLGEKSIWKWSDRSRDIVCFVEVIEQATNPSLERKESDIAFAKVGDFRQKATDEVKNLKWRPDLHMQLKYAAEECWDFSCVSFSDYWFGQNSVLLDTTFSNGNFDLINIRRAYIQGWGALALRQLGKFLRSIESTNPSRGSRVE